jgi:hypothetical protein
LKIDCGLQIYPHGGADARTVKAADVGDVTQSNYVTPFNLLRRKDLRRRKYTIYENFKKSRVANPDDCNKNNAYVTQLERVT